MLYPVLITVAYTRLFYYYESVPTLLCFFQSECIIQTEQVPPAQQLQHNPIKISLKLTYFIGFNPVCMCDSDDYVPNLLRAP